MEKEFDIEFKNYLYQVLGKDIIKEVNSKEENESYLEVGCKFPIEISEDMISLLTNRDSLLVILRFQNESKKSFKGVRKGKVDFGFQLFRKEDFNTKYDFVGFTLSIKGAVEYSDMRLDLNFTPKEFEFSKSLNYSLNIIAIDDNSIIRAIRHISFPRELCEIIRKYYVDFKSKEYNRETALEDLENLNSILFECISSKDVKDNFSLYTFTDEPEESILDKYIEA